MKGPIEYDLCLWPDGGLVRPRAFTTPDMWAGGGMLSTERPLVHCQCQRKCESRFYRRSKSETITEFTRPCTRWEQKCHHKIWGKDLRKRNVLSRWRKKAMRGKT